MVQNLFYLERHGLTRPQYTSFMEPSINDEVGSTGRRGRRFVRRRIICILQHWPRIRVPHLHDSRHWERFGCAFRHEERERIKDVGGALSGAELDRLTLLANSQECCWLVVLRSAEVTCMCQKYMWKAPICLPHTYYIGCHMFISKRNLKKKIFKKSNVLSITL